MLELVEEWPQIKAPRATEVLRECGYTGSVDVVRRRLRELRPAVVRPAQRTGYRPGQVLQLDWAELRPRIAGRERRVYALVGSLPFSGAQSAHFRFEITLEAFMLIFAQFATFGTRSRRTMQTFRSRNRPMRGGRRS